MLAVDDEPVILATTVRILRGNGFRVDGETSPETALDRLEANDYDVALSDVMMPRIDGFEFLARLRAGRRQPDLPVLFVTALPDIKIIERAFDVGAEDYIVKPAMPRELVARTRAAAHRYRLTRDLDNAEAIVLMLARAVEAKDKTTAGHCDRLAHYSSLLGERLGLPRSDIEALRRGGVLHDIGKIGIPEAVLLKPGKLTDEEWVIMRQHVRIGAELVAPLRTMRLTEPIVRYHHERFDGSGYFEGIAGERIPFLARVFQVCDVFDALTSPRPYKAGMPFEAALRILEKETAAGSWDPSIAAAFSALVREAPERLTVAHAADGYSFFR